jgi:iron complex transport system ATP-binding protein
VARASDEAAIEEALSEADCLQLRDRSLFSLSDGERQRVYFARALAQKAPLLLLDEATAHLDLAHREKSFTRARRFASEGGAVLAVAHDLDLALRHASRIVVLHRGQIVADDVPEKALSPSLLSDVFEVDAEVAHSPRGTSLLIHGTLS